MKSKRFLSFVLVFAMLMSLGITVFADAMPSVGSSEVTPITENEFAALFGSPDASADVTCKYSLSDDTSILNNSGMCVAFNLRNKVTTAFSAPYIISSQTEYRVSYTIPLSGPTSFYASANSASMTQYFALLAGS